MAKIGLQLYTLHGMAQESLARTLEEVARLGFDGVEFAGYFELAPRELRKRLDSLGLAAAGSHISHETLTARLAETVDACREIGLSTVTCTGFPDALHKDRSSWARLAEMLNEAGRRCREAGLRCGYQNHDFEFKDLGGTTALAVVMAGTQPANVFLELDIFWAEFCAHPAARLLKDLAGRCRYLHVIDMKQRGDKKNESAGYGGAQNVEIGSGVLDIPGLVRAGFETGVEWYIVKQMSFTMAPLESLALSLARLREIIAREERGGKA